MPTGKPSANTRWVNIPSPPALAISPGSSLPWRSFFWQATLVKHGAGQAAPADALHRQGGNHLVVRIAIQGHASHGCTPYAISVNIVLRLERVVRAAHGLVDFLGLPLCGAPFADEREEGRQRVDAPLWPSGGPELPSAAFRFDDVQFSAMLSSTTLYGGLHST